MSEYVAVEGVVLKFKDSTQSGDFTITPSDLNDKVKSNSNKAYHSINFTVTNASSIGVINGTGAGTLFSTSIKVSSNGKRFVLADSEVVIIVTGTSGGSPATFTGTVIIANPGQDKVKAE